MALPVLRRHDDAHVARSDPSGDLNRFNQQLAGFLDSWRRLPALAGGGFTPLADVEETPDAYLIEAELPGVARNDLEIDVAGRRVSVRGERREKERVGILRKRERTVGRFSYEITLPGEVDQDRVEASLRDGVLSVHLPKPEHARARRIEVRRDG